MVIDDTGSVEDIHAFIYCKKWRFGQVLPMPHSLTHSLTTLKDRATQLLKKYKSGALVTQYAKMFRDVETNALRFAVKFEDCMFQYCTLYI